MDHSEYLHVGLYKIDYNYCTPLCISDCHLFIQKLHCVLNK